MFKALPFSKVVMLMDDSQYLATWVLDDDEIALLQNFSGEDLTLVRTLCFRSLFSSLLIIIDFALDEGDCKREMGYLN